MLVYRIIIPYISFLFILNFLKRNKKKTKQNVHVSIYFML